MPYQFNSKLLSMVLHQE